MTNHDSARSKQLATGDEWQARLLDRYLDHLQRGGGPPPDLDPDLAQIARLASDLAPVPAGTGPADVYRARKAQTWEALMRPATTPAVPPSVIAFPPRPASIELTSSEPVRRPGFAIRPAVLPSPARLRRWRGRSLGLVATLTLVALVTLSGLAVFLTGPPPAPSPTAMLAGVGDVTSEAGSTSEVLLPNVTTCDVAPRDYTQTLQLIEPYLSGRVDMPPPYVGVPEQSMALDQPRPVASVAERRDLAAAVLPSGSLPTPEMVDQISVLWGTYQGCQRSYEYLRSASLFSYLGLIRHYAGGTGPNDHDIDLLAGQPAPDDALPVLDIPSSRAITELRLIGDDQAAGLLSTNWRDADTPPRANDPRQQLGHIFFVREGDRWLIDELTWWSGPAQG